MHEKQNDPMVFLCCSIVCSAYGQQDSLERGYKEFGLNVTGLIGQIVPFNRGGGAIGPYGMHFYALTKRHRGLRLSLGGIANTDIFNNDIRLNVLLGFERRKRVGQKFTYRRGVNAFINTGGFNTVFASDASDDTSAGIAVARGIEYHPFKSVSVSTEAILYIGAGGFGPLILVLPPFAINVNVKF